MPAHCHCGRTERDPYIRTEEITVGPPEPVISREKLCRNCGGLIKVLGSVPKEDVQ